MLDAIGEWSVTCSGGMYRLHGTISAVVEDGPPTYAQFRSCQADLYRNQDFDFTLRKEALDHEPSIGFWPAASIRFALVARSRAVASDISEPPSIISVTVTRHSKRKTHVRLPAESTMRHNFLSAYMPDLSFSISFSFAGSGCIPGPSVAYLHISTLNRAFRRHSSRHRTTIRYVTRNLAISLRMTASRRGVLPKSRPFCMTAR